MLTMKALFHRIFVCCSLFIPQEFSLSDYDFQQRFHDCTSACPFFFLRRKKNLKKKELQGGCPLDPRCAGETPQPHVVSAGGFSTGPHNADRSERGLLNVLPRTFSLASQPSKGKPRLGSCRAAREQTSFARIPKLFPLCTTSLSAATPGLPVPPGARGAEPH